jgi:hypothetical protein
MRKRLKMLHSCYKTIGTYRIIPGSNDSQYSEGHVFDIGPLVHHHWSSGTVGWTQPEFAVGVDAPDFFARGEDFSQQGINLWLSRVSGAHTTNILDVVDNIFLNGPEDTSTFCKGGESPLLLGLGGLDAQLVHVFSRHCNNFAQTLFGGGIVALNVARSFWVFERGGL